MPSEEVLGATENLAEAIDSSVAMCTTQLCFNLRRIQKPSTEVIDFLHLYQTFAYIYPSSSAESYH